MDNQFILIGAAVLVIIGIGLLIWQRNRRNNHKNHRKEMAKRTDLYTDDFFDENKSEPPVVDDIVELKDKAEPIELAEPTEQSESEVEKTSEEELPEPKEEDAEEEEATKNAEMLIVLYVVARRQPHFIGEDILNVLEETGLKHGKMDIFHHYGVGEIKVRKPVFSVANIVAPGTLNPDELADFTTPGLALFMRLPGPFGGRVAFELMLNHAERFAEALDGIVEDDKHTLINQQKITVLRERIANFEQRTVSLAMLKQFS
ncbi:cell division protein ZipA [Candidatus Halobeggiatoa sp. HSG11]|nr:cell division protein ZipA [Candidatus Halobeggiatoa sp. HSG11]